MHRPLLLLNDISLTHFKNYRQARFRFEGRITGICGPNGVGKTNLLDAIYYCCFTRSYFSRSDSQHVHTGEAGFRIEAHFTHQNQPLAVVCILRETGRKELLVQGEPCERFADHIGRLPCVMIAPDDVQIITGGSEERRRLLDAVISQLDPVYLRQLMDYNKVLQQRNGFLKSQTDRRSTDIALLQVYDQQLAHFGNDIYQKRKAFLADFIPLAAACYQYIAGPGESVEIAYESQLLHEPYESLMARCREKDLVLQRTSGGIHRDDLVIRFNDQPFKAIASQGQRKSLLFALKLAEFDTLRNAKGFPPLLLLDDVFEKLDEQRMHNLLSRVCVENNGQLFITDTHEDRIRKHLNALNLPWQLLPITPAT